MKVVTEISNFWELENMCWSGARDVLKEIARQGKEQELMDLLEELFYEGASDTDINDFIWFDVESEDFLNLYPEEDEEEDMEEED